MLKHYASVADLIRDLRRMQKVYAAKDDGVFSMRGDKPDSRLGQAPAVKVSRETQRNFTRQSNRLARLIDNQHTLVNIISSINTEFKPEDYPDIEKMRKIADRILRGLTKQISEAKQAATAEAKSATPEILVKLANSLLNKLNQQLTGRFTSSEVVNLAMKIRDQIQFSVYLVLHELKNDAGHISPQKVIAISQRGGQLYINPALDKMRIPGQFNIGFELRQSEKPSIADLARQAMQRIDAELNEDDIAIHNALPSPVEHSTLNLTAITGVTRTRMVGNVLNVELNKTIKDHAAATEISNQIYRQLFAAASSVTKVRLMHAVEKTRSGWLLKFTFVAAGKLSGRTMDREMQQRLREIGLLDKDIAKIRHIVET